jgi:hypothetical protein
LAKLKQAEPPVEEKIAEAIAIEFGDDTIDDTEELTPLEKLRGERNGKEK